MSVLIGRAWQHIFWDPPYRTLLWDENLLKPIIEKVFGIKWEKYVTDIAIDHAIQSTIIGIGIFLFLVAASCIFIKKSKRVIGYLIAVSGGILILISIAYWKEYFWDIPQFLELTAQWMSPFIFLSVVHAFDKNINVFRLLNFTLVFTFVGHGLYALGIYPLPGNWIDLVINTFHCNESSANIFIKVFGALDIASAILIFIPRLRKVGFYYMLIWGFLAAFGRLTGNFIPDLGIIPFIQANFGEFVYRIPQFILALMGLYLLKEQKIILHASIKKKQE
ncbi:MAG TPA: hypothetical protein VK590_02640 [Saprospiraceae bacterium]|nr:hypothetical protein [Saprospiraceae bacterium]